MPQGKMTCRENIFLKKLPISWKREKQNQTIIPVLSKHRGQRKDVRIYLYIYIYNFKIIPHPVPLTPLPLPPLTVRGTTVPRKILETTPSLPVPSV